MHQRGPSSLPLVEIPEGRIRYIHVRQMPQRREFDELERVIRRAASDATIASVIVTLPKSCAPLGLDAQPHRMSWSKWCWIAAHSCALSIIPVKPR